jgi:DNA polymerase-4
MGLTASVGVATSKTVAKIASDRDKPDGLTVVEPGQETAFLAPLPIGVMSGIGAVTQRNLKQLGIRTLGDLAAVDLETAQTTLGSHGPELVRRSQGIDERPVATGRGRKSVSHERTFGADVTESGEAHGAVRRLAAGVSRRLRAKGLAGRTITVKLRFSDFTTRTIQRSVDAPVFLEHDIAALASSLLEEAWSPGAGLRLLGVGVSGFEEPLEQLDLFGDPTANKGDERRRKLTESLDEVTGRFGSDVIGFGPSRRIRPATPAYDPPQDETSGDES